MDANDEDDDLDFGFDGYEDPPPSFGPHWLGQISKDPTWLTDGRVLIPAAAIDHCAQSVKDYVALRNESRSGVEGHRIAATWDTTTNGAPAMRGPLVYNIDVPFMYLRVGVHIYNPAYVAFATFLTDADSYAEAETSKGFALAGFRGGQRVFLVMGCKEDDETPTPKGP